MITEDIKESKERLKKLYPPPVPEDDCIDCLFQTMPEDKLVAWAIALHVWGGDHREEWLDDEIPDKYDELVVKVVNAAQRIGKGQ